MNTTPLRSIVARLVVIGGLGGAAAPIAPGIAEAGCVGQTFTATKDDDWLQGTPCDDTFQLGPYTAVEIHAGDGNDTVYAGYYGDEDEYHGLPNNIYLGPGNDRVVQNGDKKVQVNGGPGNDTVEGSSRYDGFVGGPGIDNFINFTTVDSASGVELFGLSLGTR